MPFLLAIAISIAVASIFGSSLQAKWPAGRSTAAIALTVFLCVLVTTTILATQFPGPSWKYSPGSGATALRHYILEPSIYLFFAIPALVSYLIKTWRSTRSATTSTSLALIGGTITFVACIPAAIIHGCSTAGACL